MKKLVGGRNRKVYTGKKGGNYYIKGGKRVYFKMKGGDKHYEPNNWKDIKNQGKYKTYDSNTGTFYDLPQRHCKFIKKTIMNINRGDIHNGQKTTVNKNEGGTEWVTGTGDPIKLEYSKPYLSITTSHGTSKVYNEDNTELLLPLKKDLANIFNPGGSHDYYVNPEDLYDYYSQCMTFELKSDFGNFIVNRKFYKVCIDENHRLKYINGKKVDKEILDKIEINFILNVKQYLKTHNIRIEHPSNILTFILKKNPEFRIITKRIGRGDGTHIILMLEESGNNYKITTRTAEIHNVDSDITPTDGNHQHNTLSGLLN